MRTQSMLLIKLLSTESLKNKSELKEEPKKKDTKKLPLKEELS
jgi:hypothetical protein